MAFQINTTASFVTEQLTSVAQLHRLWKCSDPSTIALLIQSVLFFHFGRALIDDCKRSMSLSEDKETATSSSFCPDLLVWVTRRRLVTSCYWGWWFCSAWLRVSIFSDEDHANCKVLLLLMFNIDPLCVYAYTLYEITCMCFYDDKRKCRTSYFNLDVMFIKSVFLIQLILFRLWFEVGRNFNAILMVIIIDSDLSTALCVKHVCTCNSCEFYRLLLLMLQCMLFRTKCPKRSVT